MREILWRVGALAATVVLAAACGGGGPSGPGPDVRDFDVSHSFLLTDEDGGQLTIQCTGSARLTVTASGAVTGSVTLDPCEAAQIVSTIQVPLESGSVQNGAVTFRILGQDQILGSVEDQFMCETVAGGDAFTGTLSETALDAAIEVTFQCDGEQLQGQLTVTWRIQGQRSA